MGKTKFTVDREGKVSLTSDNATGQPWDTLDNGDIVVLKIIITGGIVVLGSIAEKLPEDSVLGDVVTLHRLGTVINVVPGERAVPQHAYAEWRGDAKR